MPATGTPECPLCIFTSRLQAPAVHEGCLFPPLCCFKEGLCPDRKTIHLQASVFTSTPGSLKLERKGSCDHFSSTCTKIGTILRLLAWLLCKDEMKIREVFRIFVHLKHIILSVNYNSIKERKERTLLLYLLHGKFK